MEKNISAKTKIVCTIGPAVADVKKISQLIESGMDVARLNLSHGTHSEHLKYITNIRKAAKLMHSPVAIMIDLQGPKIRIGKLISEPLSLNRNDSIIITTDKNYSKLDRKKIPTLYKNFPKDVKKGDRILIDDGRIELRVIDVSGKDVTCKVINGGLLTSNKGMNLPRVAVSSPALTVKDKYDIMFGLKHDVDYCALSFVRSVDDIKQLKRYIAKKTNKYLPIIAKIEKPEALDYLDEIIESADGVIVARGDLGVEVSLQEVPMIQKNIIRKCNEIGKPVIVATQMLETMIHNPRPTRAEVSDVANAVLDGADAVMLSGETSIGKYPIEAVRMMDNILRTVQLKEESTMRVVGANDFYDSLAKSAVVLANQLKANAIIAVTLTGETAIRVAKHRPNANLIAITESDLVCRRLNLVYGVRSVVVRELKNNADEAFGKIQKILLEKRYLKKGDIVVFLAGFPLYEHHILNTIKVYEIQKKV